MSQRKISNPVVAIEIKGNVTNGKSYKGVTELYYTAPPIDVTTLLIELNPIKDVALLKAQSTNVIKYFQQYFKLKSSYLYLGGVTINEVDVRLE